MKLILLILISAILLKYADIKKNYSNCTFNHEDEEAIAMVDFVKAEAEEEVDQSQVEVPGV